MRNLLTLALCAVCCSGVISGQKLVTLDLSKATTELKFNETTGGWAETYNDDEESIESQCFTFVHNAISEWNTWWGFTASNSADNAKRDNFITYQFSNMAEGGILLDEDGTVKTDSFGAPVISAEMPYLVAFYSSYMSERPVDMVLDSSKSYEAVGDLCKSQQLCLLCHTGWRQLRTRIH